ncbi:MAG: NrpR regulatory domain-containing protein [Dehalococcoidia bacterium]
MLVGVDSQEVERKVILILRIISESTDPIGARIIARRMQDYGIDLTERAVRYHLRLMDERGLTYLVGRDGRLITKQGIDELKSALVQDKVGLVLSKIEMQAFQTSFDWETCTGQIPINVSLFPKREFGKAVSAMVPVFKAGLCAGDRVVVARAGEKIGELTVPEGKVALGTVCSVLVNGVLLKAGIPMDSRFGGILQLRNRQSIRFVELINYAGSSLDPSEVFIRGKMTSVREAARNGNGKILSNFREVPGICRPIVEEALEGLSKAGLRGVLLMGSTSQPVCEIPVEINKIGMILIGGMNPVAAAEEAGIEAENRAMSAIVDYNDLVKFEELQQ